MTGQTPNKIPICVDLDGTLLKTDSLHESALILLKRRPFMVFMLPLWLCKGRMVLKREIAGRVELEVKTLPYNATVITWLENERASGRQLVLATAADALLAEKISAHLGLFAECLASDGRINLKGRRKAEQLVSRFGEKGFVYAGNSREDLEVWPHAAAAVVVSGSENLIARVKSATVVEHVFRPAGGGIKALARAIRVHQWVKNLLVFVPLIAAHRAFESGNLAKGTLAFGAFCLCASGIYVLNDLLDLNADRKHALKRNRPFASGELPLAVGFLLMPMLITGSFSLGAMLGARFEWMLGLYFAATCLYSFAIKTMVLGDVICLAGLYTIRIFAGGIATASEVSHWLLAFSGFLFLSLALAKRASELFHLRPTTRSAAAGRGYVVGDLETLSSLGSSSGYISVLVLALYINSMDVRAYYARPEWLWLVCPLLLYWISRVWLLIHRGQIHEDPVVFALKDKASYAIGLLVMLVVIIATGGR